MTVKKKTQPSMLGEILREEFLKPMKITQARLAVETGIPRKVISAIIADKHGIDKHEAEALGKFFKTGPEFWINLGHTFHDLDHLAGTWTEKDAAEFERNIAYLDSIDLIGPANVYDAVHNAGGSEHGKRVLTGKAMLKKQLEAKRKKWS
jgi:addiction module HigA family antidote